MAVTNASGVAVFPEVFKGRVYVGVRAPMGSREAIRFLLPAEVDIEAEINRSNEFPVLLP